MGLDIVTPLSTVFPIWTIDGSRRRDRLAEQKRVHDSLQTV